MGNSFSHYRLVPSVIYTNCLTFITMLLKADLPCLNTDWLQLSHVKIFMSVTTIFSTDLLLQSSCGAGQRQIKIEINKYNISPDAC